MNADDNIELGEHKTADSRRIYGIYWKENHELLTILHNAIACHCRILSLHLFISSTFIFVVKEIQQIRNKSIMLEKKIIRTFFSLQLSFSLYFFAFFVVALQPTLFRCIFTHANGTAPSTHVAILLYINVYAYSYVIFLSFCCCFVSTKWASCKWF